MSDGTPKPSIPAWQRARQTPPKPTPTESSNTTEEKAPGPGESTPVGQEDVANEDDHVGGEEEEAPPSESSSQLDMVESVLADPSVKDAPLEKKRAFLESKEIPVETIDQVLNPKATPNFQASDFQSFQQQQSPQPPPKRAPPQAQTTTGPPIITYPEFLVEAHKPPPLITPARILTATYIAGGFATLVYGASKYLINPMIGNLTEARHEFSDHSQSKIDEFNDRLSKIVSKVPEPKKPAAAPPSEAELDDAESITSDPTELYHRDMGTQTISPPTTPPLPSSIPPAKKDAVTHDTNALSIINSHLTELLDDIEKHDAAVKERQESTNKLRHYLDQLLYASPGVSAWVGSEDAFAMGTTKKAGEGKKPDMVEELKKEIRGVKGVLLSARRFPGVGR